MRPTNGIKRKRIRKAALRLYHCLLLKLTPNQAKAIQQNRKGNQRNDSQLQDQRIWLQINRNAFCRQIQAWFIIYQRIFTVFAFLIYYNIFHFHFDMSRRPKEVTSQETLLYDRITKNQTKIQTKLAHLKKEKLSCCCKHFEQLQEECQPYDSSVNYYEKFWKLFLLNELCNAKLQASNAQLNSLQEKITEVEGLFQDHEQLLGGRGLKRNRRQTFQVEKNFTCPYPNCFKSYATDVALNLHIKLKHNGGNKSERDRAAQMIWHARQNNLPIPNFYINLPPGFLDEYRRSRRSSSSQQEVFQDQSRDGASE